MTRAIAAWRNLEAEGRTAAFAACGLFVSMLLPWYSKSDTVVVERTSKAGHAAAVASQTSLNAFQAFSFVEAAVLLTSAGVLFLLFKRAEGAHFRMPGGDGTVVMAAGAWAALLVFYRLLDKPGLKGNQQVTATVGVEWGIFITLLIAIGLAYAGHRMRAASAPEPPARRRTRSERPGAWVERPQAAGPGAGAGAVPGPRAAGSAAPVAARATPGHATAWRARGEAGAPRVSDRQVPAGDEEPTEPVHVRRSGDRAPSPPEVPQWDEEPTELRLTPATAQGRRSRAAAPVPAAPAEPAAPAASARSRYPPAPPGSVVPPEQLSFEDQPPSRRD